MASHKAFGDNKQHEAHTGAYTWAQIQEVNSVVHPSTIFRYQIESKERCLSDVNLPFWRDWSLSTDPSKFPTPEPLHHSPKQFFDNNFQLEWCKNILTDVELDFQLSIIQPRVGFRHFKEGVTQIKQLGGANIESLSNVSLQLFANGVPGKVVEAIHRLVDFQFVGQSPESCKEIFEHMKVQLGKFHANKQHIIDAGGCKQDHFWIPKISFLLSIVDSIRLSDGQVYLCSPPLMLQRRHTACRSRSPLEQRPPTKIMSHSQHAI
ncbi:hypothetical protein B0H19DRAFT_931463 [Mycena capillaripes]|nr:hypothetical protein B0H19DRAFT_931463 [Mycena capillaripes]